MSPMSKVSAGLQAIVLALVFVVGAAPTGVEAQGLVNCRNCRRRLRMSLWVNRSQSVRRRVTTWSPSSSISRRSPGLAAGQRGADPFARQRLLQGLLGGLADAGAEGRQHERSPRPDRQESSVDGAADAAAQCHLCGRWGDHHGRRCRDRRDRSEWCSGRRIRRRMCPRSPRQDPGSDEITRVRLAALPTRREHASGGCFAFSQSIIRKPLHLESAHLVGGGPCSFAARPSTPGSWDRKSNRMGRCIRT